jgi:hypothetical protein
MKKLLNRIIVTAIGALSYPYPSNTPVHHEIPSESHQYPDKIGEKIIHSTNACQQEKDSHVDNKSPN